MRRWWFLAVVACNGPEVITDEPTDLPTQGILPAGEECEDPTECRAGLTCNSAGICAALTTPGTTQEGEACRNTIDCELGLVCAAGGTCEASGDGIAAIGDTCGGHEDCQLGLFCYEGSCTGIEAELWEGGTCGDDSDAPFQVLFELPRANPEDQDYYRVPFPNDVRTLGGSTELGSHPAYQHPDLGAVAQGWLDAASQLNGFGPNQNVFYRLTEVPFEQSVPPGPLDQGAALGVFDLTPGAAQGLAHPVGWSFRSRQRYICDPYVTLFSAVGAPYVPDHVYGSALTTDVRAQAFDANGDPMAGDAAIHIDNLGDVLDAAAPVDPGLVDIWNVFQPFRDGFSGRPNDELASATTFTIRDIEAVGQGLRTASAGALAPTLELLHVCAGTPGPLADGADPTRGCHGTPSGFTEIQARITVPLLQEGEAPFALPSNGGAATWSNGIPDIAGYSTLELSLTVPDAAPPVDGYPVVLFAHGAQGNYRSSVESGLAEQWSTIVNASGTTNFAVLSIDTWLTGPRGGTIDAAYADMHAATAEVGPLYMSPLNPAAARDNMAQSVIDWLSAVRWLEGVDWTDAGSSPTGTSVSFDLAALAFVGHDIGGLAGPAFAAHEPRVKSVVLAGTPASWKHVVDEGEAPFPMRHVIGPVIGDPQVSTLHPMLNLGQGIIDDLEPTVHARWLYGNGSPRDVLLVHGVGDTYVGETSQEAFSQASRTGALAGPGAVAPSALQALTAPVSSNRNGRTVVSVFNQGVDPHRLLLSDEPTQIQVRTFLSTNYQDGVATVPE